MFLFVFIAFISCSKNDSPALPPEVIPASLNGVITEFDFTPLNVDTPDKASFLISANNTSYKVNFNAASQASSNAIIKFATDTILIDESREFANLGQDVISYNPIAPNIVTIFFNDGNKIIGSIDLNTSFGGMFGQALISQWRTPGFPTKPTQKAKDDIIHFIHRYADKDGPGPEVGPQYLFVTVSKN